MSHPAAPKSLSDLNKFKFQRIINEDPLTHSVILLGTIPTQDGLEETPAIVRVEKTALSTGDASRILGPESLLKKADLEGSTDIYTWLFGWFGDDRPYDVKLNIITPATEVHIKKYTMQEYVMVHETPLVYQRCVRPYIDTFPASRTQWVENILAGVSEQGKILHSSPEFVLLPDMKWDGRTVTSLYLLAIVRDRTIRCLRDLRKTHVGLLKSIQSEALRIVQEKWGLGDGSLRFFIHYQPSYYHFHVHIVNCNYQGNIMGLSVGQAHLLDTVISMLELDPDDGPSIFERITLTYGLGKEHGIFKLIQQDIEAQR